MKKIFLFSLPAIIFLAFPFIYAFVVAPYSVFLKSLSDDKTLIALNISFVTAFLSTFISFVIGTPFAYFLANKKRKMIFLDILIDIPNVLPPIIMGVILLIAYGRSSLVGRFLSIFGIEIPFSILAVVIAQIFVSISYFLKVAYSAFVGVDRTLKEEGLSIGLDELGVLIYIYLPVVKKGLVVGMLGTFSRALGEFGATIMFAGNVFGKTQTISLYIYSLFVENQDETLCVSLFMIVFSYVILYIAKRTLNNVDY